MKKTLKKIGIISGLFFLFALALYAADRSTDLYITGTNGRAGRLGINKNIVTYVDYVLNSVGDVFVESKSASVDSCSLQLLNTGVTLTTKGIKSGSVNTSGFVTDTSSVKMFGKTTSIDSCNVTVTNLAVTLTAKAIASGSTGLSLLVLDTAKSTLTTPKIFIPTKPPIDSTAAAAGQIWMDADGGLHRKW